MRRSPIRWGLFAAAVLTFSVGTVAVFPTPSYAAVPSITTMGGPINVLPSAVQSAAGSTSALSQADMMAIYIYRASKSPEFWAMWDQAKKTAAATGKPLALTADVAAEAKTIYPAASKVAPLIKGAGAVGAAITAYQMAGQLTNGALDLAGVDATGTVCTGTGSGLWGKIVQTAAGVTDCSGYGQIDPNFKINTDAAGGDVFSPVCNASGWCFNIANVIKAPQGSGNEGSYFYGISCTPSANYSCTPGGSAGVGFEVWTNSWQAWNRLYPSTPVSVTGSGDYWDAYRRLLESAGGTPDGLGFKSGDGRVTQIRAVDTVTGQVGSAQNVETGSADPQRTIKCVIAGSDGKSYQASSEQFKESAGALPGIKCADLPAGVQADSTTLYETGGDNGDTKVWDAQTDPAVKDALSKYGECGTTSVCPLVLSKDGKSCFDAADCTGWYQQADKSAYKCTYGTYTVAMSECTVYANRWEPSAQTSGNNLSNPTTGEPLKNPKPELSPGSTAAAGSTSADNATDLGPNKCFNNMSISLNPLSWVVEPFKCMFIARDGYTESMQKQAQKAWSTKAPAQLATAMSAWDVKTPSDGCNGIPIDWDVEDGLFPVHWHTRVMASCQGDLLAPVAPWGRLFIGAAVTIAVVYALTRYIGAIFGFEPFARSESA